MNYIETKVYVSSQGTEPVMAMLLAHGIENISVDDPRDVRELIIDKDNLEWDYMDPNLIKGDDEAVIMFYTEDSEAGNELLSKIKIELLKLKSDELYGFYGDDIDLGRIYFESEPLDDSWQEKWKEDIKPFKITENIVIKPTWEKYEQEPEDVVIEIDPGMAFGTGSHETTRNCAVFLERVVKKNDEVLDIGTGSGILSIIASLCGACNIDAYDVDPVALDVAKANLTLNDITTEVILAEINILETELHKKYDVIVSNLTSGIIIKMLPLVKDALKDGGRLILSGMLTEEKTMMKDHFKENKLGIINEMVEDEWYTVLLEKIG